MLAVDLRLLDKRRLQGPFHAALRGTEIALGLCQPSGSGIPHKSLRLRARLSRLVVLLHIII